jgi:Phage integrase family
MALCTSWISTRPRSTCPSFYPLPIPGPRRAHWTGLSRPPCAPSECPPEHGGLADRLECLALGPAWEDLDLVFPNTVGKPIDGVNLLPRDFHPLLERAGLPRMRFHDLRHTAATLLLGRGNNPKVVSEMLGHSHVSVTLGIYSHVTPHIQQQAADAMDQALGLRGNMPEKCTPCQAIGSRSEVGEKERPRPHRQATQAHARMSIHCHWRTICSRANTPSLRVSTINSRTSARSSIPATAARSISWRISSPRWSPIFASPKALHRPGERDTPSWHPVVTPNLRALDSS